MDQLLMNGARRLQPITSFGADKMLRNVMALQQNLKNLGDLPLHVDLDRSRSYFHLLREQDPQVRFPDLHCVAETYSQAVVAFVREHDASPFGLEECQVLLGLICHVTRDGKQSTKQ
jgi:hypothetical protein